jgi:hypothetical protein
LLNLAQPSPNSPFTAVFFEENLSQFGDLQKFKNQNVEISGTVTEYRGNSPKNTSSQTHFHLIRI